MERWLRLDQFSPAVGVMLARPQLEPLMLMTTPSGSVFLFKMYCHSVGVAEKCADKSRNPRIIVRE